MASILNKIVGSTASTLGKYRKIESRLGNGFRPYKFRCHFQLPNRLRDLQSLCNDSMFLVKEMAIPDVFIEETRLSLLGREVGIPLWERTRSEITLTFLLDEDFIVRDLMNVWMRMIDKTLASKNEIPLTLGSTISSATGEGYEPLPNERLSLSGLTGGKWKSTVVNALTSWMSNTDDQSTDILGTMTVSPLDFMNLKISSYVLHNLYPIRIEQVRLQSQDENTIGTVGITFSYSHYSRVRPTLVDSAKDLAVDAISGVV